MCFSAIEGEDVKRDIHALLSCAALLVIATVWMGASWAQNRIWRIGILNVDHYSQDDVPKWPIYRVLSEHGWVVGKDVIFELRDGGGDPRHLAEPAAELVRLKVDVLMPVGPSAVRAAFAATRDIPIVAHDLETDPVAAGYAQSYSHPGGNLTGLFLDAPELAGKWLELLKSIVPRLSRVVVLWDPTSGPVQLDAVRNAAPALGVQVQVLEINTPEDIDKATVRLPRTPAGHDHSAVADDVLAERTPCSTRKKTPIAGNVDGRSIRGRGWNAGLRPQ